MNLKGKVVLYFLLIGLVPMVIALFITNFVTSTGLKKEVINRLEAVTTLKKQSIENYFNQKLTTLERFSNNKFIKSTLNNYNNDLKKGKLSDSKQNYYYNLLDNYIRNNIQFDKLNYHDLIIINKSGDIIYTFAKEDDYKTNLISGKYKDTNLAKGFQKGLKEHSFSDIEIYTPSNKLALFASAPIYSPDNEETTGVIVIQANHENINEVMKETKGLGESGETYIVGSDYLLKSNLKLNKDLTVEKSFKERIKIQSKAIENALSGNSKTEITRDYRDVDVLSYYKKLDIKGLDWVIISEIDKSEALSTVKYVTIYLSIFILFLFIALLLTSLHTASSLATTIKYISDLLKGLDKPDAQLDLNNKHIKGEIGELYDSVLVLHNNINQYKDKLENQYNKNIEHKDNLIDEKEKNLQKLKSHIKEYKKQIKLISDEIPDGIAVFNLNKLRIVNVNNAFCSMFRYNRTDIMSLSLNDVILSGETDINSDFFPETQKQYGCLTNISCLKKDGSLFTTDIEYKFVTYKNQPCIVAFFKSSIKKKSSAESLEKLITTFSQNIKEPLLAENLVLKYLIKGTYGDLTKKEHMAIENILDSNNNLIKMLNVILDFYTYEYESLTIQKEKTSLYNLLEESLNILSQLTNIEKDNIIIDFDKDNSFIEVDTGLSQRLLINLLGNIIDYTSNKAKITISLEKDDSYNNLIIAQDYKEYPEVKLDSAFKFYYTSTKRFYNIAEGLSLYLSRQIITAHGGEMIVENNRNNKHALYISLPL